MLEALALLLGEGEALARADARAVACVEGAWQIRIRRGIRGSGTEVSAEARRLSDGDGSPSRTCKGDIRIVGSRRRRNTTSVMIITIIIDAVRTWSDFYTL